MGYAGVATFNGVPGVPGAPSSTYTPSGSWTLYQANDSNAHSFVVHPDGTIFAIRENTNAGLIYATLVGIDPISGTEKFNVPLPTINFDGTGVYNLIVAGDGNAYVSGYYLYVDPPPFIGQVSTSGAYTAVNMPSVDSSAESFQMITNADQGILVTWNTYDNNTGKFVASMAITTGANATAIAAPQLPGQASEIIPILQAQDGSYIGTASGNQNSMVSFDQSGNLRWSVPGNWQPQIAIDDGGVIATQLDSNNNPIATVIFDQNGDATGMVAELATSSWTGYSYTDGPVDRVAAPIIPWATGLWSVAGANLSSNWAAAALMPTETAASSRSSLDEAKSYMPGVLAHAEAAVQIQACKELFGTPASWAAGFAPITVLEALYRKVGSVFYPPGTLLGKACVGSSFAWNWFLGGNEATTAPNFCRLGIGYRVYLNEPNWNVQGRNGAIDLNSMSATLLHEMGHIYNYLIAQGSGGSKIIQNDSAGALSAQNDQLIFRICFP